jgi:outer membrane protein OmpA-like peptidoglycan-associated protein
MSTIHTSWEALEEGQLLVLTDEYTTLVVETITGKIYMVLYDRMCRARHREVEYVVEGPERFEGRTDGFGELLHEHVTPGDYTLTLRLPEGEQSTAALVLEVGEAEPQTAMLGDRPAVVRARLLGMFFDTSKSFLLPGAIPGIRGVKRLYDQFPFGKVLVVGHTDTAGDPRYNDVLSLERADAIAAYLQDDVDAWLVWYGPAVSWEKRWGRHEDLLMIGALPDAASRPPGEDPVVWFQKGRGLEVDGVAGPQTRRALVTEYMGMDETTLPDHVELVTHGCGESFPAVATGDGRSEQDNRRVELFFFERGIEPSPPAEISPPGSREYPQWLAAVQETFDFEAVQLRTIALRLLDSDKEAVGGAHYRIELQLDEVLEGVADDEGRLRHEDVLAPGRIEVKWGSDEERARYGGQLPHAIDLYLELPADDPSEAARRRLHNLGYVPHIDLRHATRHFQQDHGLPDSGELDAATEAKLAAVHEGGLAKSEAH